MSAGLEILREIGAQKIHEETHIVKEYAQALLHGSFEGMNKVQFLGFISILEREYNVDLNDLRTEGLAYFDVNKQEDDGEPHVVMAPKKKKSFTAVYMILAVFIFFVAVFYVLSDFNQVEPQPSSVDDSLIEVAKEKIELNNSIESNGSLIQEGNISETVEPSSQEVDTLQEGVQTPQSLIIEPKLKVWLGYIDLSDHSKHQKVIRDSFELNGSKNWLIHFGHGRVNIDLNGEIQKFNTKKNLRFVYEDGTLRKINFEEFKRLNKGKRW